MSKSKSVEVAYSLSEKSGEMLGNIFAVIINYGAEYANITYNCFKIGYDSFQKTASPNIKKALDKLNGDEEEEIEDRSEEECTGTI